jgi:dimeric dUTPase (all-alpha-NTP-PPase superfamily)
MSQKYFYKNQDRVESLLKFYGFDKKCNVTIIDDDYNYCMHFCQHINGKKEIEDIKINFEGCREDPDH